MLCYSYIASYIKVFPLRIEIDIVHLYIYKYNSIKRDKAGPGRPSGHTLGQSTSICVGALAVRIYHTIL